MCLWLFAQSLYPLPPTGLLCFVANVFKRPCFLGILYTRFASSWVSLCPEERNSMETSHLGLYTPRFLTFFIFSCCGFLCLFPSPPGERHSKTSVQGTESLWSIWFVISKSSKISLFSFVCPMTSLLMTLRYEVRHYQCIRVNMWFSLCWYFYCEHWCPWFWWIVVKNCSAS